MTERKTRKLLTREELKARGITHCREHLYRLERRGQFPKHVRIGKRSVWIEDEIDAWIEDQIAKRDKRASAA